MIEFLSEFCLHIIDFICFLYMYHILENEKINKKKFIGGVLVFALFWHVIEMMDASRVLLTIWNDVFIILSLLVYMKKFKVQDIMNAFTIDAVFRVSVSLFMALGEIIHMDIAYTNSLGLYQFCFFIVLKILMVIFMWLFIRQFKKLQINMTMKSYNIFIGSYLICILIGTTIMQLSKNNDVYVKVMFTLLLIALFSFYFAVEYITIIIRKYQTMKMEEIMDIEEKQINEMIEEQKKTMKFIHDTKNLFIDIESSIDQNQLIEAKDLIKNWYYLYGTSYVTKICRNSYIEVILRQKIEYYQNIHFNLKIQVPENIPMKNRDLLSVLMLLLNYFCENVKNELDISICGNHNELSICMKGMCHKILTENSVEYQNIQMIVEKYNGNIVLIQNKDFECRIMLFF